MFVERASQPPSTSSVTRGRRWKGAVTAMPGCACALWWVTSRPDSLGSAFQTHVAPS